jgi:hypothetical protein
LDDEENTALKTEITQAVKKNPSMKEVYAEKSVSFFSFDSPDFQVAVFKQIWHTALDLVPDQIKLNEKDKNPFIARQIQGCKEAIQIVLNSILSFHESLRVGKF